MERLKRFAQSIATDLRHINKPLVYGFLADQRNGKMYDAAYVIGVPTFEELVEKDGYKGTIEDLKKFVSPSPLSKSVEMVTKEAVPIKAVSAFTGKDLGIVWFSLRHQQNSPHTVSDYMKSQEYEKLKRRFLESLTHA